MPWVILAASLLVLLVLGLVSWFLWKLVKNLLAEREATSQTLTTMVQSQAELTRDLLNRMMSKDLQTYAAMSTLTSSLPTSDEPYIGRSDAEEAERLAGFAGVVPVGDTVYTENDAAEGLLTEIGLGELTDLATKLAEQDG